MEDLPDIDTSLLSSSNIALIIHDSEPEINKFYRYDRIWDHYRYRYDYKKFKPYTTVLSNKIDVEEYYEKLR